MTETVGATVTESGIKVLTIGHSTMSIEAFLTNLQRVGVTAIADVRTSPFSRRFPHFSKDELRATLKEQGIKYVFLGKELGGRPRSERLYCDGVADYEKMAVEPSFVNGLERVITGSKEHTIALMCSEHNPLDCHRCLLVGRALVGRNVILDHILYSGQVVGQSNVEERLLNIVGRDAGDLFASREERLSNAYRIMAKKVAFQHRHSNATLTEAAE
jgi:uncharacterized protein (DUF488 family)